MHADFLGLDRLEFAPGVGAGTPAWLTMLASAACGLTPDRHLYLARPHPSAAAGKTVQRQPAKLCVGLCNVGNAGEIHIALPKKVVR